jgi:hypothetical protein
MNENYVQVYAAYGQLSGEMIRILLESVSIPSVLVQESAGIAYGLTVGPLGEVRIYVSEEHAAQAREVIAAMERDQLNTSEGPDLPEDEALYKDNKLPPQDQLKG